MMEEALPRLLHPNARGPDIAQGRARKPFDDRRSGIVRKHQTRNLEITGSMLRIAPE